MLPLLHSRLRLIRCQARAVKVTLVMHITHLETGGQSRDNEQAE